LRIILIAVYVDRCGIPRSDLVCSGPLHFAAGLVVVPSSHFVQGQN